MQSHLLARAGALRMAAVALVAALPPIQGLSPGPLGAQQSPASSLWAATAVATDFAATTVALAAFGKLPALKRSYSARSLFGRLANTRFADPYHRSRQRASRSAPASAACAATPQSGLHAPLSPQVGPFSACGK